MHSYIGWHFGEPSTALGVVETCVEALACSQPGTPTPGGVNPESLPAATNSFPWADPAGSAVDLPPSQQHSRTRWRLLSLQHWSLGWQLLSLPHLLCIKQRFQLFGAQHFRLTYWFPSYIFYFPLSTLNSASLLTCRDTNFFLPYTPSLHWHQH